MPSYDFDRDNINLIILRVIIASIRIVIVIMRVLN